RTPPPRPPGRQGMEGERDRQGQEGRPDDAGGAGQPGRHHHRPGPTQQDQHSPRHRPSPLRRGPPPGAPSPPGTGRSEVGDGDDPGPAGASPVRLVGSWPAAGMVRRPVHRAVASPGAPAAEAPATARSPPRIRPTSSGSPHTVATTVPSLVVAAAEQEGGGA